TCQRSRGPSSRPGSIGGVWESGAADETRGPGRAPPSLPPSRRLLPDPLRASEHVLRDLDDGALGVDRLAERRAGDLRAAALVPRERGADLAPPKARGDGGGRGLEPEEPDTRTRNRARNDRALLRVLDHA